MNDDKIVEKIVDNASGVMEKAYDDIVHPSAEAVGNIVSFVPRSICVWLGKWEKWIINGEESIRLTKDAVLEKANKIPKEKLTEPEAYVAVPTIQQLSYCYNSKVLREMYANLLVSSMNKDTKFKVHPAFVDIIKQLTPDEAKLLKYLYNNAIAPYPIVDILFRLNQNNAAKTILRNYTSIPNSVIECSENISSYLVNLERLKIIFIPEDAHLSDNMLYKNIETSEVVSKWKEKLKDNNTGKLELRKKLLEITEFGRLFIKVCIEDK